MKVVENISSSESPTSTPSTSRLPPALTPVAITTARGDDRAGDDLLVHPRLYVVVSRNTYGKQVWSSRRSRSTATCSSISSQIRDAVDFDSRSPAPARGRRQSSWRCR
jgi:hypothetical protein